MRRYSGPSCRDLAWLRSPAWVPIGRPSGTHRGCPTCTRWISPWTALPTGCIIRPARRCDKRVHYGRWRDDVSHRWKWMLTRADTWNSSSFSCPGLATAQAGVLSAWTVTGVTPVWISADGHGAYRCHPLHAGTGSDCLCVLRRRQERDHFLEKGIGPLVLRGVATVVDDFQGGVGQRTGVELPTIQGHNGILEPPHH